MSFRAKLYIFLHLSLAGFSQQDQYSWAESKLSQMTLEDKVAQCFMIPAYSNKNEAHYQQVESLISIYKVGGILFFQGDPLTQATLTNRYQAKSITPLLIGIDGETGVGMRLSGVPDLPKALTVGAVQNTETLYKLGAEMGRQCKRLGIHVNFAPVADIASQPKNPVISLLGRSFGEDKYNVAQKLVNVALGMQSQGVMAVAKHYPGHGSTAADSHHTLPLVSKSRDELDQEDLFPFREAIANGVGGVITGHLNVPSIDNELNKPMSVSKKAIDILKNEMGFTGLVFTDAMNMKGVTRGQATGEADLQAFLAGNDIILQPENVVSGIRKIVTAIKENKFSEDALNERVKKILIEKYRLGLGSYSDINLNNILADLNNGQTASIKQEVFEQATTVLRNDGTMPILDLTKRLASVVISKNFNDPFQPTLSKYAAFKHFALNYKPSKNDELAGILNQASKYQTVVVSIHDVNGYEGQNYGITAASQWFVRQLSAKTNVILVLFGSPYGAKLFKDIPNLITTYEDSHTAQLVVPQIIFGAIAASGKCPVRIADDLPLNTGQDTPKLGRLSIGFPEQMGIKSSAFDAIDQLARQGIENRAYPGCQVLVAYKNKVIFSKNYGELRYGGFETVTDSTVYDLASMTKVLGTLQAVMKLKDDAKLDIYQPIKNYIPELADAEIGGYTTADLLKHETGLPSFVPFWEKTKDGFGFKTGYYSFGQPTADFDREVAMGMYAKSSINDSVLLWIKNTPLLNRRNFHYSDLGLMLCQRIIENLSGQRQDVFLKEHFYDALGATLLGYNPLKQIARSHIAPTEVEQAFRKQLIHGNVHDPNAALLGGVAGHAGLFGNAFDVAKILQMNLLGGNYGGKNYLHPSTLVEFTSYVGSSHRGIGWDKPDPQNPGNIGGIVAATASRQTFGHSGFTGTAGWVDPENELVYVFLSNRVFPNISKQLLTLKTRKRIHEVAIQAIRQRES